MDPTSTPSPKSPLEGWQFSWGGWFDNRHGEWWLLAQLALIAAHLLPPWPAPGSWGFAWPLPIALAGAVLLVVGLALAAVTVCPKAVNDSIQGNASATPAPRRK